MRSSKDVEAYIIRMGRAFHEVGEGTWIVKAERGDAVAVSCADPLVVARLEVGLLPKDGREALFDKLLRLNAGALVHAAYGLDGELLVLAAALPLENLDFNELEALLGEIDLAAAQQLPDIRALLT